MSFLPPVSYHLLEKRFTNEIETLQEDGQINQTGKS
jgi:hypothetical protein